MPEEGQPQALTRRSLPRDALLSEVGRLYTNGMSLRAVAALVVESQETVRAWLNEQGIEVRGRGRKSPELRSAAVNLYQSGIPARAVAQLLQVAPSSVLGWSRQRGVPIRGVGRKIYDDEAKSRAIAAYRAGTSSYSIGVALGVRNTTIIRWCRDAGLEIRRPGRQRRGLVT